jgi:hypothetical protein
MQIQPLRHLRDEVCCLPSQLIQPLNATVSGGSMRAIEPSAAGDWKLTAARDQPWELFNLANDRAEQHNLAAEHPEKVQQLERASGRQRQTSSQRSRNSLPPSREVAKGKKMG